MPPKSFAALRSEHFQGVKAIAIYGHHSEVDMKSKFNSLVPTIPSVGIQLPEAEVSYSFQHIIHDQYQYIMDWTLHHDTNM